MKPTKKIQQKTKQPKKQTPGYLTIKKPTARMKYEAKKLGIARKEMALAKKLGQKHIIEIEAEASMYKHAMNLSNEMWKHYNQIVRNSKKPKKEFLEALHQAEVNFAMYSIKYENIKKYLEKRMGKKFY